MALRMFLLATGERGIGFRHVFGDRVVTYAEFELLSYCQQRVLEASTDEGRQNMNLNYSARMAEQYENQQVAENIIQQQPVDFERMTPEEFAAWMRENNL